MPAKILGKLRGLVASAKDESRNGRRYTERFWDSIFNSSIFKEGITNKVYFGELWHPDNDEEYGQIHPSDDRSAIVLTNITKQGLDYIGDFDILPTTAGKTLKNLIDIGCTFGISSRGEADYNATVFDDPSIYTLVTFDVVAFPGMERARLHLVPGSQTTAVNESINFKKDSRIKIMESLKNIKKSNKQLEKYIDNTLKAKEDFDTELQVEDIYHDLIDIDDDLLHYANIININEDGVPVFNDGEHGEKEVINFNKLPKEELTPKSAFLVDAVIYKQNLDKYVAYGDWLKLE